MSPFKTETYPPLSSEIVLEWHSKKIFFILKSGCAKPLAIVVMHLSARKNDVSKKIISCPEGKTLKRRGPIPSSVKRPKLPQRVKASIWNASVPIMKRKSWVFICSSNVDLWGVSVPILKKDIITQKELIWNAIVLIIWLKNLIHFLNTFFTYFKYIVI